MSFGSGSRAPSLTALAVAAAVAVAAGVLTVRGTLPGAVGWPLEVVAAAATGLLALLAFRPGRDGRPAAAGGPAPARPEAGGTGAIHILRISELDPFRLGVHPAWKLPGGALLPPYVPRGADAELDHALARGGLVLVQGDSAAGKTRSAYEALLRNASRLGWSSVVWPQDATALHRLAAEPPQRTVVWLDGLDRYLCTDSLDDGLLGALCPPGHRDLVVLATLRTTARTALGVDTDGASTRRVLTRAEPIMMERRLDRTETRAAHLNRHDARIAGALLDETGAGLAEHIAAGPQAVARWQSGTDPAGAALISAAIDLRRAGYVEPIPLTWLTELLPGYVPGSADLARALDWALLPVRGASPCLVPAGPRHFAAFDYLVDFVERMDDAPVPPDAVWHRLLGTQTLNAAQRFRIARAAVRFGRFQDAARLWRPLAETGDRYALFNLGLAAQAQGENPAAEQWYLRAAEAGSSWAMSSLGGLAERRRDLAAAELWYRRAADAGDTKGMTNLGGLYAETGKVELARDAYRRAAAAGDANGLRKEAVLEMLHGDRQRGAELLRQVARTGDPAAVRLMGLLSRPEDEPEPHREDVEDLRRLAAEMGDSEAALDLARNLWNQGDLDAAEAWFRRAAAGGDARVAEFGLAVLLEQRGRVEEAEQWYLESARHGLPEAMLNLGTLLQERGQWVHAESWYYKALAAGHLQAEVNLGALHWARGNIEEGRGWYQRAADRGDELARQALDTVDGQ